MYVALKLRRIQRSPKIHIGVDNGSQTFRKTAPSNILGGNLDVHALQGAVLQNGDAFGMHRAAACESINLVHANLVLIERQVAIQVGQSREESRLSEGCIG